MTLRIAAAAVLFVPYAAYAVQELSFQDLINGGRLPQKISSTAIPDGFKAIRIKASGAGGGGFFDMMGGTMFAMLGAMGGAMGGANAEQAQVMGLMSMVDVSWTNGQTATLAGQTYLVTYKADIGPAELASKTPPKFSELKLTLVRTDSIQSITPDPDISRETFAKVLSSLATAGSMGGGGSSGAPEAASGEKAPGLSNAKQLALGFIMYTADWDDVAPYVQDTNAAYFVTYPYIKDKSVVQTHNPEGSFFRLNMSVAGIDMSALENPEATPLYYDSKPWPDGTRIVAFTDGHVRVIAPDEWNRLQRNLKLNLPRKAKRPLPAHWGKEWTAIAGR